MVLSDAEKDDCLLISGIALVNVLCVIVMASKYPVINILVWDHSTYKKVSFDTPKINELLRKMSEGMGGILTNGNIIEAGESKKGN